MSIAYNYEIISVDNSARVMEVVYTSEGRQTMHIGARLPYEGEDLDSIIKMYSPVPYWLQQEATVLEVSVGTSGTHNSLEVEPESLEYVKLLKKAEIAESRYFTEIGGVMFDGVKINTDRQSQFALSTAYSNLKNGLISTVDWKTASGTFIVLDLASASDLMSVFASFVQNSFSTEKQLLDQINLASSIEEVKLIVWL